MKNRNSTTTGQTNVLAQSAKGALTTVPAQEQMGTLAQPAKNAFTPTEEQTGAPTQPTEGATATAPAQKQPSTPIQPTENTVTPAQKQPDTTILSAKDKSTPIQEQIDSAPRPTKDPPTPTQKQSAEERSTGKAVSPTQAAVTQASRGVQAPTAALVAQKALKIVNQEPISSPDRLPDFHILGWLSHWKPSDDFKVARDKQLRAIKEKWSDMNRQVDELNMTIKNGDNTSRRLAQRLQDVLKEDRQRLAVQYKEHKNLSDLRWWDRYEEQYAMQRETMSPYLWAEQQFKTLGQAPEFQLVPTTSAPQSTETGSTRQDPATVVQPQQITQQPSQARPGIDLTEPEQTTGAKPAEVFQSVENTLPNPNAPLYAPTTDPSQSQIISDPGLNQNTSKLGQD